MVNEPKEITTVTSNGSQSYVLAKVRLLFPKKIHPYTGFVPEPTRLQAEGHIHHTGWAALKEKHFEPKRRLLKTDLVNFNHGQVTRTTRASNTSPNFHTMSTEGFRVLTH
ncbi:hypothetical protein TNCV_2766751 [Trichonephila clavipes]|nr:hypothetical protein TNCV_2766751 [Trichonephila clavipes]